ncbi:MAG: CRISPR-associated endonuclease Cas1 [Methanosphaera sp.]|nr:CRISPR-associated endonuclease Cas1 [Methanosphaera sp.]
MIKSKIKNQIFTLKTLNKNKKESYVEKIIKQITYYLENINNTTNKEELLGIEGISSKHYWDAIKIFIPQEYGFENRSKKTGT